MKAEVNAGEESAPQALLRHRSVRGASPKVSRIPQNTLNLRDVRDDLARPVRQQVTPRSPKKPPDGKETARMHTSVETPESRGLGSSPNYLRRGLGSRLDTRQE